MKKNILFSAAALFIVLIACGPAAEDREKMHMRAKVFQDSIANVIKVSIAESEAPAPNRPTPVPTATPAPGQTTATTPNTGVNAATPAPKSK